ncbi:MAG: glycosyltransferase, partial [Saprospiraceae bacterium]|nr:glycosyltransferase [Saprospiraceae bacterium]
MISGGGTGGHVFPAIAIADALRELEPTAQFQFVGAQGKLEMEKVPQAGYSIAGLWISGIDRRKLWRNLSFPFKLISSLWKSWMLVRQFKPDVAIGVGGYASGPLLAITTGMGVPALLQEQNSFPGITNKFFAKRASKICVAYDHMDRFFSSEKLVFTGNPVRTEFLTRPV